MLAMATLLFAASCSQEEDFRGNSSDEVTVSFSVDMPTVATRAANGANVEQLVCVVLENGNEKLRAEIDGNNNFKFTPQLINGRTYDIVFWAQSKNAYDVSDVKNITRKAGLAEDKYDAFVYRVKNFKVTEDKLVGNNVTLARPFAQLNVGITESDWNQTVALGYTPAKTVITVDNAATAFDAFNMLPVGSDATSQFTLVATGEALTVNSVSYKQIASCFVLLEDGWPNANITYSVKDAADAEITAGTIQNVPFDANYKTNIVGTMLTEQPAFNITINAAFDTPDNVVSVWDGESTEEVTPDANGVYYIENAAQFAWLAGKKVEGKLVFKSDIDMANNSMDHITAAYDTDLEVVGNNHVVSNLNVTYGAVNNGGSNGISLFYVQNGATLSIKDITFEGVTAERETGYAAVVVSYNEGTLNLDNVHVVDCKVKGQKSVGGLIGHTYVDAVINNCSVEGTVVTATGDRAGGLVGRAIGNVTITNTTVAGNTVTAASNAQTLVGQRYKTAVTCTIDGAEVVTGDDLANSDPATLKSVIAAGASKILLSRGVFEAGEAAGWASNVEITGVDKAASVLKMSKSINTGGKSITLKNLTYTVPAGLYYDEHQFAFIHYTNLVMDNCNIDRLRLNTNSAKITNCTFKNDKKSGFDGYGLFYYGADGSQVDVEECTFDMVSKGIVIYSESPKKYTLNVTECDFTASETDDKAAIQMHSELGIYGKVTINGCTATGFAAVNGGLWNEVNNNTGVVNSNFSIFVDGKNMRSVAIGNKCYATLQEAINVVKNGETITLNADLTEQLVNIDKATGVAFTIDGQNHNFTGEFELGIGENINIKNINFVASAEISPVYFIDSMDLNSNCVLNITGCTFTDADYSTVAIGTHQPTKVVIDGCTTNGVHSLLQNQGGYDITVKNTTVNGKRGMSLGTVKGATVEKVTIKAADDKYGIRLNGEITDNTITIKDCDIQAFIPIVVRKAQVENYNVVFYGTNTMTQKNSDGLWCAIGTSEYDTNGTMPTAATGKVTVTLNDAGLAEDGVYGEYAIVK